VLPEVAKKTYLLGFPRGLKFSMVLPGSSLIFGGITRITNQNGNPHQSHPFTAIS
jgi:hypothetical protein